MRCKQLQPRKAARSRKNRTYSPTSLTNAFEAVKDGLSMRRASKQYGVPFQTLRDRIVGKVDPECVTTGRPPIFTMEEEARLASHLKTLAQYGYGYTRNEIAMLATDFGKQIGKVSKPLTRNWIDGLLSRWPELKLYRLRSLEIARAKCASDSIVKKYFQELAEIITKYDLQDKPELIFNVDEKCVTPNHRPPRVTGMAGKEPQAVTTGKSHTTTIIGCGSAAGVAVPPFFVFAGKKWSDDLLQGHTPGTQGIMSENGLSNTEIFRHYLENHFLKFVPDHSKHPLLLLMDGHSTHATLGLIEWAKSKNIILFILPAHTSHTLQPLDVSCYGPFQKLFNNEIHKKIKIISGKTTRYNICEIACQVYLKALSAQNLISGFRKTGIVPTDPTAIDRLLLLLMSAEVFTDDCTTAKEPYLKLKHKRVKKTCTKASPQPGPSNLRIDSTDTESHSEILEEDSIAHFQKRPRK